jgi:hypothetical protein
LLIVGHRLAVDVGQLILTFFWDDVVAHLSTFSPWSHFVSLPLSCIQIRIL